MRPIGLARRASRVEFLLGPLQKITRVAAEHRGELIEGSQVYPAGSVGAQTVDGREGNLSLSSEFTLAHLIAEFVV